MWIEFVCGFLISVFVSSFICRKGYKKGRLDEVNKNVYDKLLSPQPKPSKPKLHDFGAFGKWDKETLLAQCDIFYRKLYTNATDDFYKFKRYSNPCMEDDLFGYNFPAHIKLIKENASKELERLSKIKLAKLTISELTKLFSDIDKHKDVLKDYKAMVKEMGSSD